jgi:alcohol dehydrogenase (cytochrome c)
MNNRHACLGPLRRGAKRARRGSRDELAAPRPGSRLALHCLLGVALGGFATVPLTEAAPASAGSQWEGYNKSLDSQRYSPLTEINSTNAGTLVETCRVQVAKRGSFQSGLVVVDGTMFATTSTDTLALDPLTCAVKWRHEYSRAQNATVPINRGIAYLNGRVFRGTDDGRLLALDALTGKEVWSNVVGDPRLGELIDGAPIAWNGLVITGTAISDLGARGRIVAYDALSGREVWRFDTIPMGDQRGADTWKNKSWAKHGGGGTWSTFTIDPVSGELFVPVGNPVPDFTPADRPGENLFTNSVVVLDARTGKLNWWYQLAPHDGLDHDLGAAPMLFQNSRNEDMVAAAGKDGYLYLILRDSHQLQVKTAVTTVDSRPVLPTREGVRSCPGMVGGVEWNGPAFDPARMAIFVGAVDYCSVFKNDPGSKWAPGLTNYGGSWMPVLDPATGWVTAVDANTGKVRWRFHAEAPVIGGVTPTAGGIVFAGDNAGNFYVFDSDSGAVLKNVATGGSVSGGVVTYEQNGKQYVAFTSGNSSVGVFGAAGRPSIIVMTSKGVSPAAATASSDPDATRGRGLYMNSCIGCHGSNGKNVDGFDLSTVKSRMDVDRLAKWIRNPRPPMPRVFPEPLDSDDERDIRDIAAYLEDGLR